MDFVLSVLGVVCIVLLCIGAYKVIKQINKEMLFIRLGERAEGTIVSVDVQDLLAEYKIDVDGTIYTVRALPAIYGSRYLTGDVVTIQIYSGKAILVEDMKNDYLYTKYNNPI